MKIIIHAALSLLLVVALSSCGKEQEKAGLEQTNTSNQDSVAANVKGEAVKEALKTNVIEDKGEIVLEPFSEIPQEYIGCGCWLSMSKKEADADRFLFWDVGSLAWVKLNGQLQILELATYDTVTHVSSFKNDELVIRKETIKGTLVGEETSSVETELVISKGKKKLKLTVFGYCGC